MNLAQKSLLWREWSKVSAWYLAHGKTKADLDGLRHALVRQACGSDLSMANWKRWTNNNVDHVLAKFRAVYDGGNLDAQLAANDQPERRLGKMEAQARNLVREVYPAQTGEDADFKWKNMLNGISRRINRCDFAEITTEKQMMNVVGALRVQLRRNEEKLAQANAQAHAASESFNAEEYLG